MGTPKVGEKVTVTLQPPGGNGMDISPNVINVDAPREFRWKGKLFVKGIFDGEHVFRFEQTGDATTHFIHEEFFGGIFKGLIMAKIWDSTEQGFREYNEALKARAEAEYKEAAS
ncbi:MAG: SRPBCC domain-containing protein [Deltaproteobacteria bacterium]|nr:SRPBCC domain-containing protein [Deltaproteobacteria bacterium]